MDGRLYPGYVGEPGLPPVQGRTGSGVSLQVAMALASLGLAFRQLGEPLGTLASHGCKGDA